MHGWNRAQWQLVEFPDLRLCPPEQNIQNERPSNWFEQRASGAPVLQVMAETG